MKKIAIVNEKGGSGKTTLTVNIGSWLAQQGKKVLLVDMDPQGQVGKALGLNVNKLNYSVFDLLIQDTEITHKDVIIENHRPNLDILPSNKFLTDFPVNVAKSKDRFLRLKGVFSKLEKEYDFILIDSPPSLGLTTLNILIASEEVIIPVSMTYLSLDGCAEIIDTVRTIRKNFDHKNLRLFKVVPTMYRDTRLSKLIYERLKKFFSDRVTKTVIRYNVQIDQAQSFGKDIFEFAPVGKAARMFVNLGKEILGEGE